MQQFVREEINYKTDDEWRELRRGLITSTAMSAILNVSQYKTKLELWYEMKSGEAQPIKENERMIWGNRLEPVIAAGIAEDNGWIIEPYKSFLRAPEIRCGSSFDFKITKNDQRPDKIGILEIKNVDGLVFKDKWIVEDGEVIEAPPYIEVQAMFQLFLTGLDYITIGAFVGGNRPITLTRFPDQQMFELFYKEITDFLHLVDTDTQPEIDWERDAEFISKLNQVVQPGTEMNASGDQEIEQAVVQYLLAGKKEKLWEERKKALKAFLLTKIGDVEKVKHPEFSISASYTGPVQMNYLREGFRNFRIFPKKTLKESIANVAE